MTTTQKAKTEAGAAYYQHRRNIQELLKTLDEKLARHNENQVHDPKNWGFAGDMDEVERLLEQAVRFLNC